MTIKHAISSCLLFLVFPIGNTHGQEDPNLSDDEKRAFLESLGDVLTDRQKTLREEWIRNRDKREVREAEYEERMKETMRWLYEAMDSPTRKTATENLSKYQRKVLVQKGRIQQRLLLYPEQSMASIMSGSALNQMVDACKLGARKHVLEEQVLQLQLAEVETRLSEIDKALESPNANKSQLQMDRRQVLLEQERLTRKLDFLAELDTGIIFSREDLSEINVANMALAGAPSIKRDVFNKKWPKELENLPATRDLVVEISDLLQKAETEFKKNFEVEWTTLTELRYKVAALKTAYREYGRQQFKSKVAGDWFYRNQARVFIDQLCLDIPSLQELRTVEDMPPEPPSNASIPELIVYMSDSAVTFGPVEERPGARRQALRLFNGLTAYYRNWIAMQTALEEDQAYAAAQIEKLEERERRMQEAFTRGIQMPAELVVGGVDGMILD